MVACGFIWENTTHQEGDLCTNSLYPVRVIGIVGIEGVALVIGNLENRGGWHTYTTIGKGGIGWSQVEQRNFRGAEGGSWAKRVGVAAGNLTQA